jgi:uncharacterized delta-60 repeat protein
MECTCNTTPLPAIQHKSPKTLKFLDTYTETVDCLSDCNNVTPLPAIEYPKPIFKPFRIPKKSERITCDTCGGVRPLPAIYYPPRPIPEDDEYCKKKIHLKFENTCNTPKDLSLFDMTSILNGDFNQDGSTSTSVDEFIDKETISINDNEFGLFNTPPTYFQYSNRKIIVVGSFISYNGQTANRIVRLNSDGSIDNTFNSGTGFNSIARRFGIQPDDKIIVGGSFTSYNGESVNRIVRLNPDGSIDNTFNSGTGFGSVDINSVVIQSDGKIIIGGSFTSYNGVTSNRIVRLNSDGSIDTDFNSGGAGFNEYVSKVAVQPDGKILVVGAFTSYNAIGVNRIVRLNSDGSIDNTFDAGTGANGIIESITLQDDGKMFVCGHFTTFNGAVGRIFKLNSDGSIDNSFVFSLSFISGQITYDVCVKSNGNVVFVSNIVSPTNRTIIELNPDGTLSSENEKYETRFNALARFLQPISQNRLFVLGSFTTYKGTQRNGLCFLDGVNLDHYYAVNSPFRGKVVKNVTYSDIGLDPIDILFITCKKPRPAVILFNAETKDFLQIIHLPHTKDISNITIAHDDINNKVWVNYNTRAKVTYQTWAISISLSDFSITDEILINEYNLGIHYEDINIYELTNAQLGWGIGAIALNNINVNGQNRNLTFVGCSGGGGFTAKVFVFDNDSKTEYDTIPLPSASSIAYSISITHNTLTNTLWVHYGVSDTNKRIAVINLSDLSIEHSFLSSSESEKVNSNIHYNSVNNIIYAIYYGTPSIIKMYDGTTYDLLAEYNNLVQNSYGAATDPITGKTYTGTNNGSTIYVWNGTVLEESLNVGYFIQEIYWINSLLYVTSLNDRKVFVYDVSNLTLQFEIDLSNNLFQMYCNQYNKVTQRFIAIGEASDDFNIVEFDLNGNITVIGNTEGNTFGFAVSTNNNQQAPFLLFSRDAENHTRFFEIGIKPADLTLREPEHLEYNSLNDTLYSTLNGVQSSVLAMESINGNILYLDNTYSSDAGSIAISTLSGKAYVLVSSNVYEFNGATPLSDFSFAGYSIDDIEYREIDDKLYVLSNSEQKLLVVNPSTQEIDEVIDIDLILPQSMSYNSLSDKLIIVGDNSTSKSIIEIDFDLKQIKINGFTNFGYLGTIIHYSSYPFFVISSDASNENTFAEVDIFETIINTPTSCIIFSPEYISVVQSLTENPLKVCSLDITASSQQQMLYPFTINCKDANGDDSKHYEFPVKYFSTDQFQEEKVKIKDINCGEGLILNGNGYTINYRLLPNQWVSFVLCICDEIKRADELCEVQEVDGVETSICLEQPPNEVIDSLPKPTNEFCCEDACNGNQKAIIIPKAPVFAYRKPDYVKKNYNIQIDQKKITHNVKFSLFKLIFPDKKQEENKLKVSVSTSKAGADDLNRLYSTPKKVESDYGIKVSPNERSIKHNVEFSLFNLFKKPKKV